MNYSKLRTVDKLDVNSKIVFLRLDLNVPVVNGSITSYKRINEALPTINYLVKNNAKIVILSHFGRPKTKEDVLSKKFSLEVVYNAIKKLLNKSVKNFTFVKESRGSILEGEIAKLKNKEILLLENTRFNDIDLESGQLINLESNCDYELSKY
ncbi:phosphoglycerate kinase [bacterium]|nr:phosphoglycerate kinase [bacterium]